MQTVLSMAKESGRLLLRLILKVLLLLEVEIQSDMARLIRPLQMTIHLKITKQDQRQLH